MASFMQRLRGDTVDLDGIPRPLAPSAPRAITAAASRINLTSRSEIELLRRRKATIHWQQEAWAYYDLIGEVWYAFNLLANVISRVRLYPALLYSPEEAPLPLSSLPEELKDEVSAESALAATRILDRLKNSEGGISTLLKDISLNICVAGELYLICKPGIPALGIPEEWSIRSIDEVHVDPSENMIIRPSSTLSSTGFIGPSSTTDSFLLPKGAFVARIWRRHPRHGSDADSSMRPLLHLCEEILLVSRVVRSTARSVLNSGILFVPDTLTVSASLTEVDGDTLEEDQFENEFVDAMATPIADETAPASAIPLLVRGPQEDGAAIRYIEIKRSFDPALISQADKALERLLNGIEVPKEMVTGVARAKYCLSEDTEIYTRSGWKDYTALKVGEPVYTINHETGLGEWQPATAINVFDCDEEPMLSIESSTHSSLSTMNHRWPTLKRAKTGSFSRRWTTSAELVCSDRAIVSAPYADLPLTATHPDSLVESAARSDGGASTDFISSLTRAQLDLYVHTSLTGESSGIRNTVWKSDEESLASFEHACVLLGKPFRRIDKCDLGYGTRILSASTTALLPASGVRAPSPTVLYTGKVWCPTTANHTWLARRNGRSFFTGNSNASSIDDNMYKAHVEPLMLMICDALNSVFFVPALKAYGVAPEDAEKLVLWYDPSEVVVRPNRTADADQGYDRKILSGQAWLRAHGFSEHDAASEEEKVLRLALDKGVLTPELTAAMLAIIAPDVLAKTRAASQAANPNPLPGDVQSALAGEQAAPADAAGPVANGPSDGSPVPTTPAPPQTESTPGNNMPANNPTGGSNG